MASPAVAIPQANGVAAPSRPDSPMSITSSTKRKRDESEDSTGGLNGSQITKPLPNGFYKPQDRKVVIRDFYHVLQRYAIPLPLVAPLSQCLSCSSMPTTIPWPAC